MGFGLNLLNFENEVLVISIAGWATFRTALAVLVTLALTLASFTGEHGGPWCILCGASRHNNGRQRSVSFPQLSSPLSLDEDARAAGEAIAEGRGHAGRQKRQAREAPVLIGLQSNPPSSYVHTQGLTQVPHCPRVVAELRICQMLYVTNHVEHCTARETDRKGGAVNYHAVAK